MTIANQCRIDVIDGWRAIGVVAIGLKRGVTTYSDRRISIIEALRGLAAVSVALFHFSGELTSPIPIFLHSIGWLGVDVFFVISGFVIPLSLYGRGYMLRDFPAFMLRRLVRLEPPYLASIVLVLLMWRLSALAPGFRGIEPSYSFLQIASHLFYAIPLTHYDWLSPVYWSLAYEFVFYILVGLTFSLLIDRRIELTVATIAIIATVCFFLKSGIDVRVLEFAVGILLMRVVVAPSLAAGLWLGAALLVVISTGGIMTGFAVTIAVGSIAILREVQLGRWAYFLGGISYSLYLTHTIVGGRVMNLGMRFGDSALYQITLMGVALAVSLVFAVLFARLVERPATAAARKIRTARLRGAPAQ
jgi:peptidoglycan/LPS O-acetylase OafA/YrhL